MVHLSTQSRTFKVVISIINFRTPDLTIQCANSVLADLNDLDGHIVIIDNFSGDESVSKISKWINELGATAPVTLVRSSNNSGFSGGHNQALAKYNADYFLILNSDALLRTGFLQNILTEAAKNPDAGFLSPRLEFPDGSQQTSCFRFHSPISEFIRGAQSGPLTRAFRQYDVPLTMPPQPELIDWASFACILLNARMITDIGPMDEGYFLYFEDVAYCRLGRQNGWSILHTPNARAVHFRGGSGPVKKKQKENKRLPAYYYASRTRYFRQFYGRWGPLLANTGWIAGRIIAHLRTLAGKSIPPSNQSEMYDIWTNTLSPLGDRKAEG